MSSNLDSLKIVEHLSINDSLSCLKNFLHDAISVIIISGLDGELSSKLTIEACKVTRNLDLFTVAVVTLPIHQENKSIYKKARGSLLLLQDFADALIAIPTNHLFQKTFNNDFDEPRAFVLECLTNILGVITDISTKPGLINLDVIDIKKATFGKGLTIITGGSAKGENRAVQAGKLAINTAGWER